MNVSSSVCSVVKRSPWAFLLETDLSRTRRETLQRQCPGYSILGRWPRTSYQGTALRWHGRPPGASLKGDGAWGHLLSSFSHRTHPKRPPCEGQR